jgi:hypothetical protein
VAATPVVHTMTLGALVESCFERVGRIRPAGRRDLGVHIPERGQRIVGAAHAVSPARADVRLAQHPRVHTVRLASADSDLDLVLQDIGSATQIVRPCTLTLDRLGVGRVAVKSRWWFRWSFSEGVKGLSQTVRRSGAASTAAPSRYSRMVLPHSSACAENSKAVSLKASLASIVRPLPGTVLADRHHLVEQRHDGGQVMSQTVIGTTLADGTT